MSTICLGGRLQYEDYERVLEIEESFGEDDWKGFAGEIHFPQPDEFYYIQPGPVRELSSSEINPDHLRTKVFPPRAPLSYRINRTIHEMVFESGSVGFRAGKSLYRSIDGKPRAKKALHTVEQAFKVLAFDCRDRGDCSLPDIAFLCPESQCAKNQRNGPCGGTRQGLCEVGEKECIWGRAYERLKAFREEENMLNRPVVFRNGALAGTSAWANAFLERDHHASRKQEEE